MKTHPLRSRIPLPRKGPRRSRRRSARPVGRVTDEGFVLLETLIAIVLIAVVMAGFTTFFVNSVAFTSQQRATQTATRIANSTVEGIRALPASDPLAGHDAASVQVQFSTASAAVTPWLTGMVPAVDRKAAAGSGPTATVPTVAVPQTINNVSYRVNSFFGTCVIAQGITINATCTTGAAAPGTSYLRAVVAVSWAGPRCPPAGCSYVTSTLLSTVDDPLFNLSQSPPPVPVLTGVAAQTSAVGDAVSVQVGYSAVPTARLAVTTGVLPAGLFIDTATGLISGTPTLVTAGAPLTLTLTDGFGRVATTSFSWTVLPALTTTAPPAQASLIGTPLAFTLPPATGGSPGYTWSDPAATLPPGLTVSTVDNRAVVNGTPSTRGVFPVTLTVADSTTTRKTTVSFSWTTDYPPLVASNPGPQTSTVGTADSVTLSVTGGSGSFAWTGGETLPAGLILSNSGVVSGAPSATGVFAATLLITDTKTANTQSVPFSWAVYARPTVTAPANQNITSGVSVSVQLTTTCPNAPCSYQLNNGPPNFGVSSSGLLSGTVPGAARTFDAVSVTVTDNSAAADTSANFSIAVNTTPSVRSPGNQTVAPGATVRLDVAALAGGGTAPLRYSAINLPSWLTLNNSTGLISGTAPAVAATTTGTVLTVTDSSGVVAASSAFGWIVTGGPPGVPLGLIVTPGDRAVTPSWTPPTTGSVTLYTATLSPGGATCVTPLLSCAFNGLTNGVVYTVTVTATNLFGGSSSSPAVTAIPYPGVMSAANGMTLWLDGADSQTLLGNSDCTGPPTTTAVGCWKDKSGQQQANNFVQPTAVNQPGVSNWNGLPAANFADTSDVLNSVNAAANYLTVVTAANVTNSSVYINMFGQSGVDYDVRIGTGTARSAPNGNDWSFNPAGTLNWTNGAKLVNANGPIKLITVDQARDIKTFTASVSNAIYARGVVGQVGDVITFNRALSTAERRSIEEFLARKWGVAITPQAPTSVTGLLSGLTSATVSWTAPAFNGGAAVTGYTVTSAPGGKTCTSAGLLLCTVTGLNSRTAYTFSVAANNSVGPGPQSAPSNQVNTP